MKESIIKKNGKIREKNFDVVSLFSRPDRNKGKYSLLFPLFHCDWIHQSIHQLPIATSGFSIAFLGSESRRRGDKMRFRWLCSLDGGTDGGRDNFEPFKIPSR